MAAPALTQNGELEALEMQLLLEGVYRHYGFDFRDYSANSLRRRVWNVVQAERLTSISGLLAKVLHDRDCWGRFLQSLSVKVTAMFRDADFYLDFRRQVVPLLRTYPFIRIWHAGCATGEEAYSTAIILHEEGIYDRCRLYATDLSESGLRQARSGIYPLETMREYAANYAAAGGTRDFSDYYTARYGYAMLQASLRRNIIFAQHNLATDGSFNEFNVILCRNVLIYFNQTLQDRVHRLLLDSLCRFGVLGLGKKETLDCTLYEKHYEKLAGAGQLYRRVV